MANVKNLEKRFLHIVNKENPVAVALTGDWGIGKTRFWNNFKEQYHNQFILRKYAYISLFGIDSLESLKYEIAVKTHTIDQPEDRMKGAKALFNKALDTVDFPKIEGKGLSLSIGKSLITSALSSLVSNTVICIDDIERVSDSLPIKDVMGLINDLKLEKNCQIIVILHDTKANEQFQEYKEKVLDDVLVLDDNLDILKTLVTDETAFNIMQQFHSALQVKNLRFYNKVFSNYQQITRSLNILSKTSKEHVLRNLLVIRWIDEFQPVIPLKDDESLKATLDLFYNQNNEFISMSDENFLKQNEKFKAFRNYLEPFYPLFLFDEWAQHIVSMLIDHEIPEESIKNLIDKDILSEEKFQDELILEQVMNEFFSLKLQPHFCERLYYSACTKIQKSDLNDISFYCDILENGNRKDLSEQLENHVKQFIKCEVDTSQTAPHIDRFYLFGRRPYDRFYEYTKDLIDNFQPDKTDNTAISSIFINFLKSGCSGYNSNDRIFLLQIDKDILRDVIWTEIDNERYRRQFIHSILQHPLINEIAGKREEVRRWIIELLHEKIAEDSNTRVPIEMWLDSTKNLTENLS